MIQDAPKEGYSRKEARRLLGISEIQLRGWEKQALVPVLDEFAFSDLIALRTLLRLRENKVPSARIRRALEALRDKLREVENPLKELRLISEGKTIAVLIEGQKMEPVSGQLLFDFDRVELKRLVSFPQDKAANSRTGPSYAQEREAELWFQKGLELEQTGAPAEDIVAAYERAIELDPHSAGALVNLGTVHFHMRAWDAAERCYKRSLEIDPAYALAYFNLGNLYDESGKYDLALQQYEEAIRLSPRYADAHYNLALLCQGNGEILKAVHHWKIYLKLDVSSSWASIARRELDKLRRMAVIPGANAAVKESGLESVS